MIESRHSHLLATCPQRAIGSCGGLLRARLQRSLLGGRLVHPQRVVDALNVQTHLE